MPTKVKGPFTRPPHASSSAHLTHLAGCRNCSRRRINCDRTLPHCRKCVRDNLECYGLDGTFRWMAEPINRRKRTDTDRPRRAGPDTVTSTEVRSRITCVMESFVLLTLSDQSQLTRGNDDSFPCPEQPLYQPEHWVTNFCEF